MARQSVLAIIIVLLTIVAFPEAQSALSSSSWKDAYVETGSGLLHYWQSGEGETTLFIHGNAASGKWFTALSPPEGYRIVAPDMPGFGLSFRPGSFGIKLYAQAMWDLIDALGIDKLPVLLGHSLGGLVAVSMAASNPDAFEALILTNTPYLGRSPISNEYLQKAGLYASDGLLLKNALAAVAPTLKDTSLAAMMFEEAMLMDARGFTENPKLLATTDQIGYLSCFDGDILFIGCALDATIPPNVVRYNSALTPGSSYVEMQGVGHAPMLEDPAGFMRIVESLLNRH